MTTMLQQAGLKLEFWAEALQTAVYLINLVPSRAIRLEVPQALWSGKQLTYDRLRIFGCEAYVFILKGKRTKLASHATKCIFLSYGTDGDFDYRLWDPENKKLIWSNNVVFNEDSIFSKRNQQKRVGKKVSFEDDDNVVEGPTHRAETKSQQTAELEPANHRINNKSSRQIQRQNHQRHNRIDQDR